MLRKRTFPFLVHKISWLHEFMLIAGAGEVVHRHFLKPTAL